MFIFPLSGSPMLIQQTRDYGANIEVVCSGTLSFGKRLSGFTFKPVLEFISLKHTLFSKS